MTAVQVVYLYCDVPSCDGRWIEEDGCGGNANMVRRAAQNAGWSSTRRTDRCPAHTAAEVNADVPSPSRM